MSPISLWIARIFSVACLLICYLIFVVEMKARAEKTNDKNDKYKVWLNRWSLFGLVLCFLRITCLVVYTFPIACIIFNIRYGPPQLTLNCIITCYQISRLHHAFDTEKDMLLKWTFNFLYLNGIGICLFVTGFNIITTRIISDEEHNCVISRDPEFVPYWLPIVIIWYYIWDISVLVLYIYKLRQLKHGQIAKQSSSKQLKINLFLRKILILMGWIEINTLIFGLLAIGFESIYWVGSICLSLDVVMAEIIICLMCEHNHDKYAKLMNFMTRLRLCCCCQTFVYQSITASSDGDIKSSDVQSHMDIQSNQDIEITSHKDVTNNGETQTEI